ncbi:MAG: hypothetical protein F6K47_20150 [Symploca sp. SIO2E6]|nr:hypothetical protein [Symploca sp. SIO2E6]
MKASKVLKRYNNGRRDFSGECLRGQSFKGKNLEGADFSEADIRGANFSNAKLSGAKFCGAKAGLQRRWAVFLVAVSWLLSALSGLFSIWMAAVVALLLDTKIEYFLAGVVSLIVLAVFFIVTIRKGLAAGFGAGAFAGAFTVAFTVAGVVDGVIDGAFSGAFAGAVAGAVAGAGAFVVAGAFAVAGAFVVAGAFAGAVDGAFAVAVAVAVPPLGTYLGWRSVKGDERDAWIRAAAIAFTTTGGTSFRGAILTDADFTGARLKSTDFREATLTRTRWRDAKRLNQVRPGTSYLSNVTVRELARTLQGPDKNFDQLPLRGINLQGANLADASFIGTDLNEANLQDADLSRAKLVQTPLDETDLTGVTLTAAYIEDWGITSTTKLDRVRCDYVFMRLPTKDKLNPHRKPDDWSKNFAEGEFADFIAPMVRTLDLYHTKDTDSRLIVYAWQKLVEENPEAELEIVSIEKRGKSKDKLLLRAETSPQADHSQLSAEYFDTYDYLITLPPAAISRLLADKDNQISRLEGMVTMAISRPGFYAQHYSHQGDTMPDKSSDISISAVTGSKISGVAGGESTAVAGENLTGVAGGDISGTVTNTISQLSESELPEAPTLANLLKQLKKAITSPDFGLSEKDKKKALKHLDTIGKLGVERNNSNLREMAENSMDALPTILKRGAGLFDIELDEILDNIQSLLGMEN